MIMLTFLLLPLLLKTTITFLFSLISQTMSSTFQAHTLHESEGEREFSFWGSSNTLSTESDCDHQLGDNEARLSSQAEFGETYIRKNLKFEHHSPSHGVSDPSKRKAIAEGRKELMEMMQDMPESSYELSFQDMVDEQQVQQPEPDQNETLTNNKLMQSSSNKSQPKKLNKKNKNKGRPGQILRVESMDSETFFLKIFFPTSLDWIKKGRVQNGSKVSPRQSLQEPLKREGKEWRIKRFFLAGNNRGDAEDGCDKSRYVDRSFSISHGCWPFFHYMKSITKKLGG